MADARPPLPVRLVHARRRLRPGVPARSLPVVGPGPLASPPTPGRPHRRPVGQLPHPGGDRRFRQPGARRGRPPRRTDRRCPGHGRASPHRDHLRPRRRHVQRRARAARRPRRRRRQPHGHRGRDRPVRPPRRDHCSLADVGAVAASADALDAPVAVLSSDEIKGLEFDAVVVVEPSALVREVDAGNPSDGLAGLRALFVTLTRAPAPSPSSTTNPSPTHSAEAGGTGPASPGGRDGSARSWSCVGPHPVHPHDQLATFGVVTASTSARAGRWRLGGEWEAVASPRVARPLIFGTLVTRRARLRGAIRRRAQAFAGNDRSWIVIVVLVVWWIVTFSQLVWRRHDRFGSSAFDMGIYDQAVWLLSRFQDFDTVRGLPVLGHHVDLNLILLAPFSRLGAGPAFLNIFQVVSIGMGAVPVYLLGRRRFESGWPAVCFALGFLAHPSIQSMAWELFHPDALAITPLLCAWYTWRTRRWGWTVGFLVYAMAWKEDVALFVVMLGLVWAARAQWRLRRAVRSGCLRLGRSARRREAGRRNALVLAVGAGGLVHGRHARDHPGVQRCRPVLRRVLRRPGRFPHRDRHDGGDRARRGCRQARRGRRARLRTGSDRTRSATRAPPRRPSCSWAHRKRW